jgi:LemA protein
MGWFVLGMSLALAAVVWIYNRLVRARNQVRTAWSDIDVQLLRRHDLVPLLVETVKAYATHEQALLENVATLRSQALASRSPAGLALLEDRLEQSLDRLLALEESYPDLKASENFLRLQRDLIEVEEQLQYARRFYNGAVRNLNDAVQRFPHVIFARAFGFRAAEFFSAASGARDAPTLELAP